MTPVTFITGNQGKADYLARYLGYPVAHRKIDLDELQSLDLRTIVEHKVRQAYEYVHAPVLVEDVSLEFAGLGRLPGPFIKFFLQELSPDAICALVNDKNRTAIGRCTFGYYDGQTLKLFEGSLPGTIASRPAGDNGFGWDKIFIPDGYTQTRAELSDVDYQAVYERIRPLSAIKAFLEGHHSSL